MQVPEKLPDSFGICSRREEGLEEGKLFRFTRFPKSQWKSIRTSHAIVVRQAHHEGLHEEFRWRIRTQTVLPV